MVKFQLENIGLIKNSEIALNDLTLVCGQNNTGKTYITYSIYGFLATWKTLIDFGISSSVYSQLDEDGFCKIDISTFQANIKDILDKLSKSYTKTLGSVFSVEDDWFEDSSFRVLIDDVGLDFDVQLTKKLYSSKKEILHIKKEENSQMLEVSTLTEKSNNIPHFVIENEINSALGQIYFGSHFKNPFVITSERTGISLFYKELDINKNVLVEHITKNKGRDIDPFQIFEDTISRYALPVKHNIDYIRDIGTKICKEKSFLYGDRQINKYFSDILRGSYKVTNKEVHFVTKKTKEQDKKNIPIYFSSSATKSLLEMYFYINHSAKKGDILIIDEPELNLHPNNHIIMARLLAHLANRGIFIFITTHSDYLVKEFNNLIRLKQNIKTKEEILKKYKYQEDDNVDFKYVSAYVNNLGKLSKIDIDKMGMEVSTFDDTINDLSNAIEDIYYNIEE